MTVLQKEEIVPASIFNCDLFITKPITYSQVQNIIEKWIIKQDEFWPAEISAEILSQDIQCVNISHWVFHASASGNWSASIGKERVRYEVCSACKGKRGIYTKDIYDRTYFSECNTCGGSGQEKKTYIDWVSESGVVNASIEGKVIENISEKILIKCGKRNFDTDVEILLKSQSQDVYILQPIQYDENYGNVKAEELVREKISQKAWNTATRLGKVKDFQIAYVNIENAEGRIWLYPIFIGNYEFEEKNHLIQIDGVTGKLFIEVPLSIKKKRWIRTAKIVGITLSVALVIYLIYIGYNAIFA